MQHISCQLCHATCGILVPRPIEPTPPTLETQIPNHWTASNVTILLFQADTFTSPP